MESGAVAPIDRDLHCRRFGKSLKRHRRDADLSMDELSERTGLHRSEICKLEKAHREPRLTTIIKVARGLRIDPSRLLDGVDAPVGDAQAAQSLPSVVLRGPGRRPQGGEDGSVLPAGSSAPCPGSRTTTDGNAAGAHG
jgi:DNA-binding XRE family transcriptional regulator